MTNVGYSVVLRAALVASLVLGVGCIRREAPIGTDSPTPQTATLPVLAGGARWRLAPRAELGRSALSLSHILIRHEDVQQQNAPFHAQWPALPQPPARSRHDALELAQEIVAKIQRDPTLFEELASKHNEDSATLNRAGLLGAVSALEFWFYPPVLDAISALTSGQCSSVLETAHGFHIFRVESTLPSTKLSGRRIVIGHDAVPWLEYSARRDRVVPRRTVAQATELARVIAQEVATKKATFSELAEKYSDVWDVTLQGDIGVWRQGEPSQLRHELHALAQLEVGEISEPFATYLGIVLVERTSVQKREAYGAIVRRFPLEQEDGTMSQERAYSLAEAALRSDSPIAESGGAAYYWQQGRGPEGFDAAVAELELGEKVNAPFLSGSSYVALERVEPQAEAPALMRLPSPRRLDLGHWLPRLRHEELALLREKLESKMLIAIRSETLAADPAATYDRIHRRLERAWEQSPGEMRVDSVAKALGDIRRYAGSRLYERYRESLSTYLERILLASAD